MGGTCSIAALIIPDRSKKYFFHLRWNVQTHPDIKRILSVLIMGDHLLKLPLDALRLIWRYLSLPDVIRFGITTKSMLDLTWPWYQELLIMRFPRFPSEAISFVLKRDLTHLRHLELMYEPSIQEVPIAVQWIEALKSSNLPNLQTLAIDLVFSKYSNAKEANYVNQLISAKTQLQSLRWYSAQCDESFNVGQFFANHTRLTSLTIRTDRAWRIHGVHLLTQVKDLHISHNDNMTDDDFIEAMGLTQLVSTDIAHNKHLTDKSFTQITKLTNLEQLYMSHANGLKSTSLKVLRDLPKLSDLSVLYPWDDEEYHSWDVGLDEIKGALSIIGQLSNLTKLQICSEEERIDFGQFTQLTNLMCLNLEIFMEVADFTAFTRLTRLEFPRGTMHVVYPPNVKHLTTECYDKKDFSHICSLEHLQSLVMAISPTIDHVTFAQHITKLSRLSELTIESTPSPEQIEALQKLPNLATLTFVHIPDNIIDNLAKLTQVIELTYFGPYQKELKAKVPFNVVFLDRSRVGVYNEFEDFEYDPDIYHAEED